MDKNKGMAELCQPHVQLVWENYLTQTFRSSKQATLSGGWVGGLLAQK